MELLAGLQAEPPADSLAEPPADSRAEPLADPPADSLADSLADPPADSRADPRAALPVIPVGQLVPVEEHPRPLAGHQMKQLVAPESMIRPAAPTDLSWLVSSPPHSVA